MDAMNQGLNSYKFFNKIGEKKYLPNIQSYIFQWFDAQEITITVLLMALKFYIQIYLPNFHILKNQIYYQKLIFIILNNIKRNKLMRLKFMMEYHFYLGF